MSVAFPEVDNSEFQSDLTGGFKAIWSDRALAPFPDVLLRIIAEYTDDKERRLLYELTGDLYIKYLEQVSFRHSFCDKDSERAIPESEWKYVSAVDCSEQDCFMEEELRKILPRLPNLRCFSTQDATKEFLDFLSEFKLEYLIFDRTTAIYATPEPDVKIVNINNIPKVDVLIFRDPDPNPDQPKYYIDLTNRTINELYIHIDQLPDQVITFDLTGSKIGYLDVGSGAAIIGDPEIGKFTGVFGPNPKIEWTDY